VAAGGRRRDVCAGRVDAAVVGAGSPLERDGGLTVFKSVGTAVQDLAAASAVAGIARERGLGRELDILTPKTF
jgi:ornithine cyclodeaminase/alanine dehydrogenase-like protein (mu-crystallin family)